MQCSDFLPKEQKDEEPFIEINYKDAEPENAWCDLKFRNKNINIPGLTYNPLDKNYYYEAAGGEVYQCTYRARYLLMKILKEKNCKIDVKKNWGNKNREDSLHINLLLYK